MKTMEVLSKIDPKNLEYDEWLRVGMAIKKEDLGWEVWDTWSMRDFDRYVPGECERKYSGFTTAEISTGTLVFIAQKYGATFDRENKSIDWDDIIDMDWIEDVEIDAPQTVDLVHEITTYLSTLFESSEYVGIVTEAWYNEKTQRWLPKKGTYSLTAGEIIERLSICDGDTSTAIGDYDKNIGAWVRFNPLDGNGISDSNVTSFRYALVEFDRDKNGNEIPIEKQAALYKELEIPVTLLIHSGNKSLHAIVKINATTKIEYRERVNFLYDVFLKSGFPIDTQNKNPSRLSRLPGVQRGEQWQYIVGKEQGKGSFEEWREWIEAANDNLPDFETFDAENVPDLAEPLIDGVLRRGHKMLLAGPSKAGKSFLLLELAIAIAEGGKWLGWDCKQGPVLYVNLELDKASCINRIKNLYGSLGIKKSKESKIDLWHMRGKSVPMDVLAPKLIRRAIKNDYTAIIIDPIYKVITGDENAADKMAHFCNQFDRLCTELGCAVIYCHHHSKGSQGQKNSMDRASGSGVFARDPDAILDLIELAIPAPMREAMANHSLCDAIAKYLCAEGVDYSGIAQDATVVATHFLRDARELTDDRQRDQLSRIYAETSQKAAIASGWRIEGTLREFPSFERKNIIFEYPRHVLDFSNVLVDAKASGEEAPWVSDRKAKAKTQRERAKEKEDGIAIAFESIREDGESHVLIGDIAEALGITIPTAKKRVAQSSLFAMDEKGIVYSKDDLERKSLIDAFDSCADAIGECSMKDLASALSVSEKTVQRKIALNRELFNVEKSIIRKAKK